MEREILFRGKNIINGDWEYGWYLETPTSKYGWIIVEDYEDHPELSGNPIEDLTCSIPVEKETVGQFTGLTDKNGSKIFEGDILNAKTTYNGNWADRRFQDHTLVTVVFYKGCFIREENYKLLHEAIFSIVHRKIDYEITGNIHDKI